MLRLLAIFSLLLSCLFIAGCSGCRDLDDDQTLTKEEREKKEKEKKKPDFVTRSPVLLPGWFPKENSQDKKEDDVNEDVAAAIAEMSNPAIRYNRAKLGHWMEAHLPAIANNYNASGQLTTFSSTPTGQPVPVPSTDYFLTTTRPASLAKGEWKNLETSVFLPRRDIKTSIANVSYSFDRGTGGIPYINLGQPTSLMKPYQYHIVLLSDRPDTYNFLKLTDSFQIRGSYLSTNDVIPPFYYLVPTNVGDPLPLPRQSLNWTTIAYLIWDDYDPDSLSQDHQDALLDWLHFGGQLILSGPDCLDKLQNSFLGNYLPAQFDGSRNITNADLTELNANWSVTVARNAAEKRELTISEKVPVLGVKFKPHAAANYIKGMGELAIERAVGRGRILVTGFSLSAPAIRKWRSFPSFVNNVLLRRPAREFGQTETLDNAFAWENDETSIFDPLMGSTLRYISRDLSEDGTPEKPTYSIASEENNPGFAYYGDLNVEAAAEMRIRRRSVAAKPRNSLNHWHFGGYADAPQSGAAGWNDDSGVALAARKTLREAAGITPPSSKFVLKMLAGYLVILVPLNWLVFRLIGHVEWAWIAAPFIAIIGAVLVVKMAALDIGFVRSNTQLGLLEVHANYQRAHATEYSALYTSLSTRYNVELDNGTAQSLPFARVNESQFAKPTESYSRVEMKRTVDSRLEGFQIQSNSTGLLHTEYMLDLEGTLYATFDEAGLPTVLNNGSVLNLQHTGVVRRLENGEYQIAWIGELASASASANLQFETVPADQVGDRWRTNALFVSSNRIAEQIWDLHLGDDKNFVSLDELQEISEINERWSTLLPQFNRLLEPQTGTEGVPMVSKSDFISIYGPLQNDSKIKIGDLFDTVVRSLALTPGEVRLLATTDQRLGRTQFKPEATQTDQQTLVVVHLKRPPLPIAKRDLNALTDFTGKSDLDWDREMKEDDALFGE